MSTDFDNNLIIIILYTHQDVLAIGDVIFFIDRVNTFAKRLEVEEGKWVRKKVV